MDVLNQKAEIITNKIRSAIFTPSRLILTGTRVRFPQP